MSGGSRSMSSRSRSKSSRSRLDPSGSAFMTAAGHGTDLTRGEFPLGCLFSMKRSSPAPWLALTLTAAALLAAAPARAQAPAPAYPQSAPPWPPPYAQPVPPPPTAYVAVWPPPAYAQPASSDTGRRGPLTWYGWQTLLAVAPFDIAMFAGLGNFSSQGGKDAFFTGFVGRNLAPSVVHMAHGRVGTGFASIGLHAATTATGIAIGYGIGIALEAKCAAPMPCTNHFLGIPPGPDYGA